MAIESTKSAPAGTDARRDAAARPQQKLKGALILSAAVLVTGVQDLFIKDLSAAYPVWEMQIFRGGEDQRALQLLLRSGRRIAARIRAGWRRFG